MNAEAAQGTRKLMLALDAGRCCPADVALAVELAALVGAKIEGLFVEDSDLMGLAQLPFAREVGGSSGQDRPIVRESMESLMRRRIERTVGELERVGKLRNVPVSHTTARGKVVRQALEQGESRDLLLLNPRAAAQTVPSRVAGGPVMVWYEDGDDAAAVLDLGVELAVKLRTDLLIGYSAQRLAAERDVRIELSSWLHRIPGRVRMRAASGAQSDAAIALARAARAAQLVLDAKGRLATEQALEHMLASLVSRVILVR